MMFRLVLFLFTMTHLISCLRSTVHYLNNSKQPLSLSAVQSQLKTIDQIFGKVNKNISLRFSQTQQLISDSQNPLFNISKTLNLPFNYKQCICYDFTELQRNNLKKNITEIQQSLNIIKLSSSNQKQDNTTLAKYINHTKYLKKNIEGQQCCKNQLSQINLNLNINPQINPNAIIPIENIESLVYQTNLRAVNWTYGNLNKDIVKLIYFNRSINHNVSNCPQDKPFFDQQSCINCEAPNPYFDLSTSKCTNGEIFDSKNHQLINNTKKSNEKNNTIQTNIVLTPLQEIHIHKEHQIIIQPIQQKKIHVVTQHIVEPIQQKKIHVVSEHVVQPIQQKKNLVTLQNTKKAVEKKNLIVVAPIIGRKPKSKSTPKQKVVEPILGKRRYQNKK